MGVKINILDYWEENVIKFGDKVTEAEIIGNQAPFYFNNSTLDIYLILATGAKLVIIPEDKYISPLKLFKYSWKSFLSLLERKALVISVNNNYLFSNKVLNNKSLFIINFHNALLPRHKDQDIFCQQ